MAMNIWDLIILAAVGTVVLLAFRGVRRSKKNGCASCSGCAACEECVKRDSPA